MKQFGILNKEGNIENELTKLFGIKYPLIQAGMIWASGWELASAVSNAGGLGIIGAGSMYPHILDEHIIKCKAATDKPFAVNLPLLYPDIDKHVATILKHKVPIVFTSAGNPKTWTATLKEKGVTVVHVVSSSKFALKSQEAGVDAVVAEGFEAGGHNGREETTTLCLIPAVAEKVNIPVIAAGGIYSGKSMLSAMILGASGVQVGSRFVCSNEASTHINFKNEIVKRKEGETELVLKSLAPVRLIKNEFYHKVKEAELRGAEADELKEILGRARAKLGMYEGNLTEGELEIGQVSGHINAILPAAQIVDEILSEFKQSLGSLFALTQGNT